MLRSIGGSFGRLGKAMWMLGGASALLLALLLVASASVQTHALGRVATMPAAAAVGVGSGLPGLNLYEYVGRVDQAGVAFTGYGYLSYVRGMDNSQIFSNPLNPSEGTAHFTYYATSTLTSRAVISGIFAIDSIGPITFYYQPTPSAAFDDPTSFAAGTPIATGVIRYQSILNVQAPNQGISDGIGEFVQATAVPFSIGGVSYQFGQAGMVERMTTFGQGTRLDAVLPKSFVVLSGNAVDTGQRQLQLPYVSKDTHD